jgi:hypothetical protein
MPRIQTDQIVKTLARALLTYLQDDRDTTIAKQKYFQGE